MSPWGARERPSTAAEEDVFIARVRQLAAARTTSSAPTKQGRTGGAPFQRYDITALVTALRNGVTADEMFRAAPGLRPESVAAAYDYIEERREDAADAWRSLVADPTVDTLARVGEQAAALLPAVISQLRSLLLHHPDDPLLLEQAVAVIDREIRITGAKALELENLLTSSPHRSSVDRAAELLVGESKDGLWSLGSFLPPRVGTLVSARLRGMLGEQPSTAEQYRARARSSSAVA
jgi:hypothetical protein